eukprot:NODE_964_length_1070_cov_106.754163_g793_i0.p1 GENE.NODE_964_length_1070_cov_106.754163_g793_i0~~NODE_964_length_1070_cov_106.754163_g793_i0.p1  ORF type:complete len:220 (+),score=69.64 NODE_964_length_1070_cov_106.754163_g793_i0:239-898(+)
MDQSAVIFGKDKHFIELDCSTLDVKYHPLPLVDTELVLINSMVKHALADGAYNTLRNDMETAEKIINQGEGTQVRLIDMPLELVEKYRSKLTPKQYARSSYVIEERARTDKFIASMEAGDVVTAGKLMRATHAGLSKKLENSTEQLDFIVEQLDKHPGMALGGRVMGGGFGGCIIALIKTSTAERLLTEVREAFKQKFSMYPEVYRVAPRTGAYVRRLP